MDNFTKTAVVGNVVVTIGILLVLLFGAGKAVVPAGNYLVDVGNQAANFGATSASLATTVFSHLTNLEVNQNLGVVGTFFQGATAETGNPLQVNANAPQTGTFNCNTGTSTLFAVKPPSGATSTVTFLSIQGNVAQISDIVVGTSTLPSVTATSTLNVTGAGGLFGIAAVAIGHFFSITGFKVGPGTGYTPVGNGPYNSASGIVVGPNEYLVGYATSTAITGGNGATSCTYKIEWYN